MAILGTYKGQSIINFPASPGLRQLQIDMNDTVAMQRSPFVGTTQVQAWPGADFWTADLTLPQMNAANAAIWAAFLGECRGMQNCFYLGHPLYQHPMGSAKGAPVVSGVNVPMATSLITRGWLPTNFRLLLPGDRIQIGFRLHMVLDVVDSDASGNATISIWPSIREATADGEPVVLNKPQGLWRLADNKRSVLSTFNRFSSISFKLLEAR